ILTAAAQEELMPRFNRLGPEQVARKTSAFDVVTVADEMSEAAITARLRSVFPGAAVVGEEAVGRDPELLHQIGSAELAFVVDPLDGTKNFASGLPLFGVMAAVTIRGRVAGSVIHDPVTGSSAYALKGHGAWIVYRDRRRMSLWVAQPLPVAQMDGIVGTNFLPEPLRANVNSRLSRLATTSWLRCAAHEYRLA